MIIRVKEFVIDNVKKFNNKISIDDIKEYNNNKLELVLSTDEYMASLSIFSDYTYDFLVVEIVSENIVMNNTETCNSIEGLYSKLEEYIFKFSRL